MNSGSGAEDSEALKTHFLSSQDAEAVLADLAGVFFKSDSAENPERAEVRDASVELEARYKTLMEQIPAVVFMAPLEGGLTNAYVSPHIEAVLGFTQEQWLNDPVRWYYQIHPDDRDRWSKEAASLFLSGQPLRSVYRVMARDGHPVWFQCEAKMVRKPDGRPWFIHGVAFDISDIMRAEQALQRAHNELELRVRERTAELADLNAELEKEITRRKRSQLDLARQASALAKSNEDLARSNQDLEQFAYSASHDLQEPIRNLAVYSEWLSRGYKDKLDGKALTFLKVLMDSADRMSRLIQDLLEYTRVSADFVETEKAVDANQVMTAVLQNLETAIRESKAIITTERLPSVDLSRVRLQQVLQNLVLNAIKYRGEEPLRVHISAACQDGFWRFAIKDNGIGIAPEYHDQIFGIFKRLSHREEEPEWDSQFANASWSAPMEEFGWNRLSVKGPLFCLPCPLHPAMGRESVW